MQYFMFEWQVGYELRRLISQKRGENPRMAGVRAVSEYEALST
jgi:hypothetical protein